MNPDNLKSGDNDDLEALFDEIAEQRVWDEAPAEPAAVASAKPVESTSEETPGEEPHDVFRRVGSLTRKLHDALRELGYDKSVENAVNALPDARARLNYIADLTGKAAEKVLAAVEALAETE
jgi:chemotaxis protein CheZ